MVSLDQRGCGASRPHAGDHASALSLVALDAMIADLEELRRALGVERWLVLGASWGATLALAYTAAHRERVSALVLIGATTTSAREIDWLFRGLAPLFPEAYADFRAGAPPSLQVGPEPRGVDIAAAYLELLIDPDKDVREDALRRWRAWETAAAAASGATNPNWDDPRWALARARITAHVFSHRAWLEDGALLRAAERFGDLPGAIVQGAFDIEAPRETAWRLSQAWPSADHQLVAFAGHGVADDRLAAAARSAIARLTD